MNVQVLAQIYTDLVNLENEIPEEEYHAKEQINVLRSKYHNILMDQMVKEGIDFADHFDATRKAFELIQKQPVGTPSQISN